MRVKLHLSEPHSGFTFSYYQNKLNLAGLGLNSVFRRIQAPYSIMTYIIIKYNKEWYILVKINH